MNKTMTNNELTLVQLQTIAGGGREERKARRNARRNYRKMVRKHRKAGEKYPGPCGCPDDTYPGPPGPNYPDDDVATTSCP